MRHVVTFCMLAEDLNTHTEQQQQNMNNCNNNNKEKKGEEEMLNELER